MRKIRQSVFETNSSSTHSICIAITNELIIPKSLHFGFGEFGWECDTLSSTEEKASYLYTGLMNYWDDETAFKSIADFLLSKGIIVTHEEPIYKKYTYEGNNGDEYIENGGYVDHGNELREFLMGMTREEEKLMQFLFSPLSFIITGNDNDDEDVDINVDYPHEEYYKGN